MSARKGANISVFSPVTQLLLWGPFHPDDPDSLNNCSINVFKKQTNTTLSLFTLLTVGPVIPRTPFPPPGPILP